MCRRHLFVDEALASRAYEDTALPIGLGQTISQPWVVARMTEALLEGFEGRNGSRDRHGLWLPDCRTGATGQEDIHGRAYQGTDAQDAKETV